MSPQRSPSPFAEDGDCFRPAVEGSRPLTGSKIPGLETRKCESSRNFENPSTAFSTSSRVSTPLGAGPFPGRLERGVWEGAGLRQATAAGSEA